MPDDLPVKILIVDDLPENRLVYQSILNEPAVEVISAGSGAEALQLLLHHDFAVILLDVNMPDMSGFETAALIRSRKRCAHTPIIFVTAYADELHTMEGYSKGAVDYILSPVIADILQSKVRVFVKLFRLNQQVRAQAVAAEEESARLSAVLESAPDLVGRLDPEGRLLHLNRAGRKMLGIGLHDPLPAMVTDAASPVFAETWRNDALTAAMREGVWFGESTLQDRSGREIPVSMVVQAHKRAGGGAESLSIIARDISQRIQTQQELHLLKTLSLAIGSAQDLNEAIAVALREICQTTNWDYGETWLPDEAKRHLQCVPVHHIREGDFSSFAGVTQGLHLAPGEGLPGRVWRTRKPEWLRELSDDSLYIRAGQATESGLRSAVAIPVLSGAETVAIMVFAMRQARSEDARLLSMVCAAAAPLGPLILRKRAEAELARHRDRLEELVQERTDALKASLERLRVTDRLASIGTLAAGLGHDMGNLLLPVRLRLEALADMELPPAAHEDLAAIKTASEYLQRLSQGLRLFAMDPEEHEDGDERTDLNSWWNNVEIFLRSAIPKNVNLEFEASPGLPMMAIAPHRFTQSIYNLVKNAGDAFFGNGGLVRVTARNDGDRHIAIAVQDNGPGMPEKVRRRCMEPFFTTKARGISTGLGLALVRGAVLKAGGSIDLESQPGVGTTFRLLIPVARQHIIAALGHSPASLGAMVRIRDQRLSAYCAAMLASLGCDVEPSAWPPSDRCLLAVLDGSSANPEDAAAFLAENARRRAVIVSSNDLEIPADQLTVLSEHATLLEIRAALENSVEQTRMNVQEALA